MVQARRHGSVPMSVRRVAAIARATERDRVTRRLAPGACGRCGHRPARVGPWLICRNLTCATLVVR